MKVRREKDEGRSEREREREKKWKMCSLVLNAYVRTGQVPKVGFMIF